jgi:hypothetical protein
LLDAGLLRESDQPHVSGRCGFDKPS